MVYEVFRFNRTRSIAQLENLRARRERKIDLITTLARIGSKKPTLLTKKQLDMALIAGEVDLESGLEIAERLISVVWDIKPGSDPSEVKSLFRTLARFKKRNPNADANSYMNKLKDALRPK